MQVHMLHRQERSDIYKNTDPIDEESYIEELSNSNNIYIVAELKNKIVGICFASIKEIENNKVMKNRRVLYIENICIDKDIRKKGIGKKLYKEMLKYAEEQKVDSIELMVWEFNKNAISFYENLGMTIKNLRYEQKLTKK